MILGALISLGVESQFLENEIAKVNLPDISLSVQTVDRSGISSIHVEVRAPEQKSHRHLSHIERLIDASGLSDPVKQRSAAVFRRLAEAEARVHGISIEKVHFHEVGAIDAIADVVGACIGFESLGIESFACSPINVGSGFVEMEHGKFPVPPPAVVELLRGFSVYSNEITGELITPTGAAIITTLCRGSGPMSAMNIERSGFGAGTRTYEKFPNVLRAIVGDVSETKASGSSDEIILIETNIDDISPQVLGYVMDRSFELGALDCWFTPIQMKKNRPATLLSVLCPAEKRADVSRLLYTETTTLGLRVRNVERECLSRELVSVTTRFGRVDVKVARLDGQIVNAMPEYDQIRKIAIDSGLPFRVVHEEVTSQVAREISAAAAGNQ
jgi:uncharacterized protein (TIGR00299 family) protein